MITKRLTIVASLTLGLTILSTLSAALRNVAPAKTTASAKNSAKKGLAKYADKTALIEVLEKEINNAKSKLNAVEKKILHAFKDGIKAASLTKLTCLGYFARLHTEGKNFLYQLVDSTDLKFIVGLWPDFEKLIKSS